MMAHSMACQAWQVVEPSHYHTHYLRGFTPQFQCTCAVQALKHSVVSNGFLWPSLGFGGGATNWFNHWVSQSAQLVACGPQPVPGPRWLHSSTTSSAFKAALHARCRTWWASLGMLLLAQMHTQSSPIGLVTSYGHCNICSSLQGAASCSLSMVGCCHYDGKLLCSSLQGAASCLLSIVGCGHYYYDGKMLPSLSLSDGHFGGGWPLDVTTAGRSSCQCNTILQGLHV